MSVLDLSCDRDFRSQSFIATYCIKKIIGNNIFSTQFIKILSHYKTIDYSSNVLRQTACLVVNPIMVDNFAFLFNYSPTS